MLTNYHMHTPFCDGKNSAEEMVQGAIEKGFCSIGFSGHGHTPYDTRYCMAKDVTEYIAEINRLKKKYADKIEIYLGIEEDSRAFIEREKFDYIIGSCHYVEKDGIILPFDSSIELFENALKLFGGDAMAMAESYYTHFCNYILQRKPTIIGHFDLITKYEEKGVLHYFNNPSYWSLAENAVKTALKADCIFELNTGIMYRGYRTTPCPHERLLRLIAKENGKITLSSDSHDIESLGYQFTQMKRLLTEVGFKEFYVLQNGAWKTIPLTDE